ncbi:MAG TPA: TlpA disulfide reductase family protein [Gemmatimonadales bacterium]|jgi:peroxiredoxin
MRPAFLSARRFALPLALAVAAVLVVALARQNRALLIEARHLRGQQRLPHAGDVVPPVRARGLDGDTVLLGGGPTTAQALFVFTTTCPYCAETLPAWKRIAARLENSPTVVSYGVSLDPDSVTAAYASLHQLPFPVVRFPTARAAAWYRAIGAPLTLLVDSTGEVLYARAGVLSPGAVDSLFAALSGVTATSAGGRSTPASRR